MAPIGVAQLSLDQAPWHQLRALLEECYPRPPRDVFQRVVALSHRRQLLWLARDGDTLLGMVMLSPHSKGGHLENLAVDPSARGLGIARKLVQVLLHYVSQDGPGMVSLTTRIPSFFSPFGFQSCGQLDDCSTAMLIFVPGPSVSNSPAP